jgi:histidyl-tRNA synthetase
MKFQAPRGTADVLPAESHQWVRLESAFREVMGLYGYGEIRTPTFEDTALFSRTAGETSDIVTKQMYTFLDKGDRSITLKPEGTAPAMRAALEHKLIQPGTPLRLFYITPCFRYERPQKGRLRELHQFGFELIGSSSPEADAEVIEITVRFYERIGLQDTVVLVNSLGREECRATYRAALLSYAAGYLASQSEEARARLERNPLRLLDLKDPDAIEAMKGAPKITDYLEDDSRERFELLQRSLKQASVRFELAPEIVRGLDYYTETVFEVQSTKLGAQGALCGGGRYDGLIEELGGPATPAVGVGMGIERALIVLGCMGEAPPANVFLAVASPELDEFVRAVATQLRAAGISVVRELEGRALKQQFKTADRLGTPLVLVIGEDEVRNGTVTVKAMASGEQVSAPVGEIAEIVRARL